MFALASSGPWLPLLCLEFPTFPLGSLVVHSTLGECIPLVKNVVEPLAKSLHIEIYFARFEHIGRHEEALVICVITQTGCKHAGHPARSTHPTSSPSSSVGVVAEEVR